MEAILNTLLYQVYMENFGWQGWVQEGRLAGIIGQSLRMEAIRIKGVKRYRVHVQNIGWMDWVNEGEVAGTIDKALRIEAIEIEGENINYQVHIQNDGWLDFARDGETAGSEAQSLRIEAIRLLRSPEPIKVDSAETFKPAPAPVVVPDPPKVVAIDQLRLLKAFKLYLAIGHGISQDGSWDSGCVDGPYTEAALMLELGKVVVADLRTMGFTVLTDADHDNNKNIAACVAEANNWGADAYISLHCDYNQAPSGTLPIAYPGSTQGVQLANFMIAACQEYGLKTRGIIQRDDWEVADTNMIACIFETGSIREDIKTLQDVQNYGNAIAKGICNYANQAA
ncbi:N-acetylmuramoyl-L-alanine amidase [Acetobacterium wieringae]|uniref:N-acetylmuramoyl-L-alanine amidase n=1 Tax=Acetobacterium wieringae TaxID=52694 RepID=UPI0020348583|nr:N-acetylmuramoyl-L-alanine amidase [Acetobacterium wieringae]URN83955.1 N-acetylmuramoyl-L-alanine amidase [Acetobacterium wieringae]